MDSQLPSAVMMIRPRHFGFNPLTASSNAFQQFDQASAPEDVSAAAMKEFDDFVKILEENDVETVVFEDRDEPATPDSVFPNNWISFHHNGSVILYPMLAENRRLERREDILMDLQERYGFLISGILDLSTEELNQRFLEGTGSIVFDYRNRIAYANPSPRTDVDLLNTLCDEIGFRNCTFPAVDENGREIYHANVMMCIGDEFVVICLQSIVDEADRIRVVKSFENSGHEIIDISFDQMNRFAGNMLEVLNRKKEPVLIMSDSAYKSLGDQQIKSLSSYADIVHAPLETIEKYGGGSARCMLAGIFLQKL